MTIPKRDIGPQGIPAGEPRGLLCLRTLGMPADTNQYGDIFGGWLLGQMDIAGGIFAAGIAKGRRRNQTDRLLVTDGNFTYVALDSERQPRAIDVSGYQAIGVAGHHAR